MKHIEAMKLALEALEDTLSDDPYPYSLESKAITALREALAEQPAQQEPIKQGWDVDTLLDKPKQPAQQEPVGWLDSNDKLAEFMHKDLKAEHDKRDSSTPRAFQIPVYTTPPQRIWVGLTDEEVQAAVYDENNCVVDYEDYARAIEAILREKNS